MTAVVVHALRAFGVIAVALFPACTPPPHYRVVYRVVPGATVTAARGPSCAFDLLLSAPSRSAVEIGVVAAEGYDASDAEQFRLAVASLVCEMGGDAIIAQVREGGHYPRGVVLRYAEPSK